MRENYNSKINSIIEQLITKFPFPITKTSELSKCKQVSIKQLSNEDLIQTISYLIQQDNDNLIQNDYTITKDIQFSKSIESQSELLKQNDYQTFKSQLIFCMINQVSTIVNYQLTTNCKVLFNYQNEFKRIRKQELDEIISASQQIQGG
ncbi:unnamed protein product (macronuclear) [Paramecium tetraurelia]|uniref:Uncharacterized protein n=1 Tax=Paramecium tetraurelia TaxID=5888 RepID=A0CLP8_PARTE|nr:uncharacterized protein GSPATT00038640001 [Paramecium tetraurelia]CAK71715.1 unnamed protein product [Paramecium tetraurelia]|eukprot:XP_001439112.1 hypothetical protein (macronuclear) [Paramecium tetraurelia strain d4-2]